MERLESLSENPTTEVFAEIIQKILPSLKTLGTILPSLSLKRLAWSKPNHFLVY
jgi:hypothetical protein